MKIALYFKTSGIGNRNLTDIEIANPGIGGTQYNFLCLPIYYDKYFSQKVVWYYFSDTNNNLSKNYKTVFVDENNIVSKLNDNEIDIFIYRYQDLYLSDSDLDQIYFNDIKIFIWSHNTPFDSLNRISKNKAFTRYITVAQEQLDMLMDHNIFFKSLCIPNGFNPQEYENYSFKKDEKLVVYLGSLVPAKGFHALARVWPKVLHCVPDAKLKVIGSGKLYNNESILGKYDIAEESYENKIMKLLSYSEKNKRNVEFLGLLGKSKIKLLQKASVGIVNPTGLTENCPGSAIEFQASKTPVVSGAFWGLLDTVMHDYTGLLAKNDKQLVKYIIRYLNNHKLVIEHGLNGNEFIKNKFDYKYVVEKWNDLIFKETITFNLNRPKRLMYNNKLIIYILFRIKYFFKPYLNFIPPFIYYRRLFNFLNNKIK